ncbi:MAG: glycosyltransferase [Bacteroidales bacterium]|nr:glycosyltransferase [Bacteroidales bacterium]
MTPRRIVLSVTNDLVTDQRVHRSCTALMEAGYIVTLIGRRLPHSADIDRPYRTVRMRLLFTKKAPFYAEYNLRLLMRLLFTRTDAFYANDTDTLPANWVASRLRKKPLLFDAHEMFPEVPELVGRPRVKHFWKRIEDFLFPRLQRHRCGAVTVCQSIADIYHKRYGLKMAVVRNVPLPQPTDARQDNLTLPFENDGRQILLYQGAVNIGRGIEWIMDAMPYLPECIFVVAGTGDIYNELCARAQGSDNILMLGRVEPPALHRLTPLAALGMSLLENRGLNYYYSLPNRIADFIQAGVPVLATDFPEIHRVIQQYAVGTLVDPPPFDAEKNTSVPPDPEQLAHTIRHTLNYWNSIPKNERQARFSRAAKDLSFQNDKKTLLDTLEAIFH